MKINNAIVTWVSVLIVSIFLLIGLFKIEKTLVQKRNDNLTLSVKVCDSLLIKCDSLEQKLVVANDSISILDSLLIKEIIAHDFCQQDLDSTLAENISLKTTLLECNYKFGRIKAYCDIVKNDSSQLKYLRGWINRVLED